MLLGIPLNLLGIPMSSLFLHSFIHSTCLEHNYVLRAGDTMVTNMGLEGLEDQ